MFCRGSGSGHIFRGRQRCRAEEFSQADEETLVMFASQAALVIANARTHREERRARADLETLIDTSPVGVLVIDARTGELRCRSTGRPCVSWTACGRRANRRRTCWRWLTFVRSDGRQVSSEELPLDRGSAPVEKR